MTDNDWTKQLHSKMDGHQEPVPDGLWQDIEKRLQEHEAPSRPMPAWRRYASAAVALAVIGTGCLLWLNNDDTAVNHPVTSMTNPDAKMTSAATHDQDETTDPVLDSRGPAQRWPQSSAIKATPTATGASDNIAQANTPIKVANIQESSGDEPIKQATEQATEQTSQTHPKDNERHAQPASTPQTPDQRIIRPIAKRGPLTLGLYASNIFKSDGTSNNNHFFAFDPVPFYQLSSDVPSDYSEYIFTAKHHAPLSLGLSVRVPITSRFSLTSGLVYSRLKSDFTSKSRHREQTLHYLGVPIGATYTLWNYRRLNIYAIGGMQADFNVKATLKENSRPNPISISNDRVQFSALAGPGLQLDLTQGFGIYIEPTVRYYFNNGSDIENYFKDKPWNINLNAGLRLTLQ